MGQKKIVQGSVLFAAAFFLVGVVSAQRNFRVPAEMPIATRVRAAFPAYFGKQFKFPQLLAERFYPIGFSRDGKFAFVHEPVDEACGCYFANVVVQDLVTDKVLWELKVSGDEGQSGDDAEIKDIRSLWRLRSALINEKLNEYRIAAGRFALLPLKFRIGGKRFEIETGVVQSKDADGNSRSERAMIDLRRGKAAVKRIATLVYDADAFLQPLDVDTIGAIKSPFEDRVAVLAVEVFRGYEGPPHTARIKLIGASLTAGF
ncbi:MAG: hypothetical protein UZ17_ACD001001810 [Acidobacteria bacterium OLB17]|nr:MAG: hypothetical protein UZ17_ACD001001810 [Acidobacteria bacterium OLB17]MCZ2390615.1 hypothetical protein [Acidobacteriota bacterium]